MGTLWGAVLLIGYWLSSSLVSCSPVKTSEDLKTEMLTLNYSPTEPAVSLPTTSFEEIYLEEGKTIPRTLAYFKGKPGIIHFWAPWCPACRPEISPLYGFLSKHPKEMTVILVSAEPVEKQRKFFAKRGITHLTFYVDEGRELASALGVDALPTSIFFNAKGQEIGRLVGALDWQGKEGALVYQFCTKLHSAPPVTAASPASGKEKKTRTEKTAGKSESGKDAEAPKKTGEESADQSGKKIGEPSKDSQKQEKAKTTGQPQGKKE